MGSKSKTQYSEWWALVRHGNDYSESFTVKNISDAQCGEKDKRQRQNAIKVEDEVIDVEVPRGGAVKVWTMFWPTQNVVTNDIPWDDDEFSIYDAVDTYNGDLNKKSNCNFCEC